MDVFLGFEIRDHRLLKNTKRCHRKPPRGGTYTIVYSIIQ